MTKIFILTRKTEGATLLYTALKALTDDNTREVLGVSKATLDRIDFSSGCYENDKVKIERYFAKNVNDVAADKKRFT